MKSTRKSSRATAEKKLKFAPVAIEKIVPPSALFDERVPINEDVLAPFLPIIVYKKSSTFIIVDGCKRFAILKKQGRNKVTCGIIEAAMSPARAGLLRIGLNSGRRLHPREKLLFVGWLKAHFDQKEYREQAEKLLGSTQNVPANERHEYEQLLACKPWLVEAVLQGTLDPTVAPEMNHLPEGDAQELIKVFTVLAFSRQMQRELAEWLPEIAFIQKISLAGLLAAGPLAGILSDKNINDPQKTARFHDHVHAVRFPLYTETKKAWMEQCRKINPDPSKVTFQPSPYFEKNSLEIRIKANDAAAMKQVLQKLAEIDMERWKRLVDPTTPLFIGGIKSRNR
jgi:hypothetical protein